MPPVSGEISGAPVASGGRASSDVRCRPRVDPFARSRRVAHGHHAPQRGRAGSRTGGRARQGQRRSRPAPAVLSTPTVALTLRTVVNRAPVTARPARCDGPWCSEAVPGSIHDTAALMTGYGTARHQNVKPDRSRPPNVSPTGRDRTFATTGDRRTTPGRRRPADGRRAPPVTRVVRSWMKSASKVLRWPGRRTTLQLGSSEDEEAASAEPHPDDADPRTGAGHHQ